MIMPAGGKFAVMGNPVGHSLSPRIHAMFAKQCGIELEYTAILVREGEFEQAVKQFIDAGGRGLNVTVPFKLEAWNLAGRRSERAQLAGAVNTLILDQDGSVDGDNTDGIGLLRDITINLGKPVAGARVLVIGAGGAVRGVLGPLLEEHPAVLHVINRTASRAVELAAAFAGSGECTGSGLDQPGSGYDIVINGTAASLQGEVPDLPAAIFAPGALAYDMMYGDKPTPFMSWAQENGAGQVADGLGMLVEQAAESFRAWHGVRPETSPVIAALR
jgi:shikimate dehydrogenase